MKPFAIAQMEQMVNQGCSVPGCTHKHDHQEVWVIQRCHPGARLGVRYKKGSGVLNVVCGECEQPVLDVAVALV